MKMVNPFLKKQAVFFIDSAIANYAPSCLATKRQFIHMVLQSLANTGGSAITQVKQWSEQHFEDFNQVLYQELGFVYLKLFEIFHVQELNALHRYLAQMMVSRQVSFIIHLGWDDGLECALKELNWTEGKEYLVVYERSQLKIWNWEQNKPTIVKLRGSIQHPNSMAEAFEIYEHGLSSERLDFFSYILRKYYAIFLGMDGFFPHLHHYILETLPCSCPGMSVVEQNQEIVRDIEKAIHLYGHKIEIIQESESDILARLSNEPSKKSTVPCNLVRQNNVLQCIQTWAEGLTKSQAHQVWASLLQKVWQSESALSHRQKILELALQNGTPLQIAKSYISIGRLCSREAIIAGNAKASFQSALDVLSDTYDDVSAGVYEDIGKMHFFWQKWDDSLHAYDKALQIYKKLQLELPIARVCGYIAGVYEKLLDLPKALYLAQEALTIYEKEKDVIHIAKITHHIGQLQYRCGNISVAEELYRSAQEMAWRYGDIATVARIYGSLAILEQQKDAFFDAQRLYSRAGVILERIGEFHGASLIYYNLALLKYSRNDIGGTTRYLQRAQNFASACHNNAQANKLHDLLRELERSNSMSHTSVEMWNTIDL